MRKQRALRANSYAATWEKGQSARGEGVCVEYRSIGRLGDCSPREVSSSCSDLEVCVSAFGSVMAEYASPVCEKVSSSTPVMRTPRAIGKVDFCAAMDNLWSTMLLRSPCASAVPVRSVNFFCQGDAHRCARHWQCARQDIGAFNLQFKGDTGRVLGQACWKIARVASCEGGDQVAFCLRRQRSDSDARMFTTTVRERGCSGLLVWNSLETARDCSLSIAFAVLPP